jgi:hypothetical protein
MRAAAAETSGLFSGAPLYPYQCHIAAVRGPPPPLPARRIRGHRGYQGHRGHPGVTGGTRGPRDPGPRDPGTQGPGDRRDRRDRRDRPERRGPGTASPDGRQVPGRPHSKGNAPMPHGCGSSGVSAAGRGPARHVPGGRRAGRGHRDVILRALQRPQNHIAGVSGPWPGRGRGRQGPWLAVAGGTAGAGAPGEGPGTAGGLAACPPAGISL